MIIPTVSTTSVSADCSYLLQEHSFAINDRQILFLTCSAIDQISDIFTTGCGMASYLGEVGHCHQPLSFITNNMGGRRIREIKLHRAIQVSLITIETGQRPLPCLFRYPLSCHLIQEYLTFWFFRKQIIPRVFPFIDQCIYVSFILHDRIHISTRYFLEQVYNCCSEGVFSKGVVWHKTKFFWYAGNEKCKRFILN